MKQYSFFSELIVDNIDRDYKGNAYSRTKQVARCGNAVPPPFAEALVRVNLPEMCGAKISTMKELKEVI